MQTSLIRKQCMRLLLTSSTTSRIAASFVSSPGSTPPEGTTQRPGCRQLETSSTYNEQTYTYQSCRRPFENVASACHVRRTNVTKPLFPARFWSKCIPPALCIHLYLSFWYCLSGSLSFSWVQTVVKQYKSPHTTQGKQPAGPSPWQDCSRITEDEWLCRISKPLHCGKFTKPELERSKLEQTDCFRFYEFQ